MLCTVLHASFFCILCFSVLRLTLIHSFNLQCNLIFNHGLWCSLFSFSSFNFFARNVSYIAISPAHVLTCDPNILSCLISLYMGCGNPDLLKRKSFQVFLPKTGTKRSPCTLHFFFLLFVMHFCVTPCFCWFCKICNC